MPKIRNIVIFVAIAGVLILAYIFFVKPSLSSQPSDIVSQSATSSTPGSDLGTNDSSASPITANFLTLLLSVKTMQLDTDIFSDPAFVGLHDSTIVLVPDAATGRANPFAQFGAENVVATPSSTSPAPSSAGNASPSTLSIPVVPKTPPQP